MKEYMLIDRASGKLTLLLPSSTVSGTFQFDTLVNLGSQTWQTPASFYAVVTIEDEQILLSGITVAGGVATATIATGGRGYNGTTAADHVATTPVQLTANSEWLSNLQTVLKNTDTAIGGVLVAPQTVPTIVDATTMTLTGDQTAVFKPGNLLVYQVSGVWYRALITASVFSTLTTLTVSGTSLPASGTVDAAGLTFQQPLNTQVSAVSSSAGVLTLIPSSGNVFEVALTENITSVSMANGADGQNYVLRVKQGAGNYAMTFGSAFRFSGNFSSYTPSTANGDVDYVHFRWNGDAGKYDIFYIGKGNSASPVPIVSAPEYLQSTGLTADRGLLAGDLVAAYGTDSVRRASINGVSSGGGDTTITLQNGNSNYQNYRAVDLSSTLKIGVAIANVGGGLIPLIHQIKVNPTTGAITSVTQTALSANTVIRVDVAKIDATTAIVVYSDGGVVWARVASSLDGSISLGTEVTVRASVSANPSVAYYDDNNILFFSKNTGTQNIQLDQYTRSGGTLTAGTSSTAITDANTKLFFSARFYDSTKYLMLFWEDSTNSRGKVCAALYDTTAKTVAAGTPVSIGENIPGIGISQCLDSTNAIGAFTSTTTAKAFAISRSGTVLTPGSTVSLTTACASNGHICLTNMNAHCVGFSYVSASVTYGVIEISADATTVYEVAYASRGVQSLAGAVFRLTSTQIVSVASVSGSSTTNLGAAVVAMSHNYANYIGAANAAANASANIAVDFAGQVAQFSGLSVGRYYLDMGGVLTTQSDGGAYRAGVAVDATTLVVQP